MHFPLSLFRRFEQHNAGFNGNSLCMRLTFPPKTSSPIIMHPAVCIRLCSPLGAGAAVVDDDVMLDADEEEERAAAAAADRCAKLGSGRER